MERKRPAKRDNEAQSQRFIETARELGAEASDEKFERLFKKVVPSKAAHAEEQKPKAIGRKRN